MTWSTRCIAAATMAAQGYTQNSGGDWLGYVYPNLTGNIPTVQ